MTEGGEGLVWNLGIKVKLNSGILSFSSHTPVQQGHTSYSVRDASSEKEATNFMFTGGNLCWYFQQNQFLFYLLTGKTAIQESI